MNPACPLDAPLRDRLAQLVMVRLGSNMTPPVSADDDEPRVAELLRACPVGGIVLFNGTADHSPATLARLQAASRYRLLVAADFERGVGQQLHGYPLVPHAMAFGALGPRAADAVREFGVLTGAASRAAGVHMPFAPVADVNTDPRNPIIATRALGTDPARVATLVAAFVESCRAGGALAVAKHFPGHGHTHVDSHHALPTVGDARATLASRDLPPFVAAIAAGAPAVMTAHVAYPALDAAGTVATLSAPILDGVLRRELGFDGVVVSDSLLMEGAKLGAADARDLAVRAVQAGVDLLVDVADPVATVDALEAAVRDGRLSEKRVNQAVARLNRLPLTPPPADFDWDANRRATERLACEVARGAVQVTGDAALVPFDPARSTCAILVNHYPRAPHATPPPLDALLAARFSRLSYWELGAEPSPEELWAAERAAAAAAQVLLAVIVKPAAWRQFGVPAPVAAWLESLAGRRQVVAACLGAPAGLDAMPSAAARICTLSDVPASCAALVETLTARRS